MIIFKKILTEGLKITYNFESIYSGSFLINKENKKIIINFDDDKEFLHTLLYAINEVIIKNNYPDIKTYAYC